MKVEIECAPNTPDEREEFIEDLKKYGVKAKYKEDKHECNWILEGKESAVKHVIAEHWQVDDEFKSYDELVASGDIGLTILKSN